MKLLIHPYISCPFFHDLRIWLLVSICDYFFQSIYKTENTTFHQEKILSQIPLTLYYLGYVLPGTPLHNGWVINAEQIK